MILSLFDLQVTLMLPTKFQVNWPFGSGEDAKNRFSRRPPSLVAILDFRLAILAIFDKSPRCFLPSLKSIGPSVQEKKRKIDFQDGTMAACHGGHLGFPITMVLAIFDLYEIPSLIFSENTNKKIKMSSAAIMISALSANMIFSKPYYILPFCIKHSTNNGKNKKCFQ